jgi:hypothetical protein
LATPCLLFGEKAMILILFLFLVFVLLLVFGAVNRVEGGQETPILILSQGLFLVLFVNVAIISVSYHNYLEAKTFFEATNEQYSSAISMYEGYARLSLARSSLTDFKDQNYQNNLGKFVQDLKIKVISYNEIITKKRILKDNPIFSWLIIAPDDNMVPLLLL